MPNPPGRSSNHLGCSCNPQAPLLTLDNAIIDKKTDTEAIVLEQDLPEITFDDVLYHLPCDRDPEEENAHDCTTNPVSFSGILADLVRDQERKISTFRVQELASLPTHDSAWELRPPPSPNIPENRTLYPHHLVFQS